MKKFRLCVAIAFVGVVVLHVDAQDVKTPDPVQPAGSVNTGACCFQPTDDAPYSCTITTQLECALLPNSVWNGPNTTCFDGACPETGACCYQPAGLATSICAMTTQLQCTQALHGTFFGNNFFCSTHPCPSCIVAPKNLVAWWPMDELAGVAAHDSLGVCHAKYAPFWYSGPTPGVPGVAGNALHFDGIDDNGLVIYASALDVTTGPFTIDTWIRPTAWNAAILTRMYVNLIGYELSLSPTGLCQLRLGDSCCVTTFLSTQAIPLNQWSHVAVTVTAGPVRTAAFYRNSVLIGVTGVGNFTSLSTPANNRIGSSNVSGSYFQGEIDELQFFDRALDPGEIEAIYNAGAMGRCKTTIHAPWDFPFCLNQNQVTVPITICNQSPTPKSYNVGAVPLNTCSIAGPTLFSAGWSNPISIPANQCVTVSLTITRPAAMNALNQVACYEVFATDIVSLSTVYSHGSLQDRRDLCAVPGPCCILEDITLAVGQSQNMSFTLTNTSPAAISVPYMAQAMDAIDMSVSDRMSLNGLPPGTRYIGNLALGPGASADLDLTLSCTRNSLRIDDIILSTDIDLDGIFEPLISVGGAPVPLTCFADIQPVGGDQMVNIIDLTSVILAWGTADPFADINNDGTVNILDLTAIILSWGACP